MRQSVEAYGKFSQDFLREIAGINHILDQLFGVGSWAHPLHRGLVRGS